MLTRSDFEWLGFAIAAAIAAHFVAVGGTPIDRHLPFVVILLAASGRIAGDRLVQLSAPLLLVAAMFLPDEHNRLFAYGIIAAAAFAFAVFRSADRAGAHILLTIAGVLLLRWIPFGDVVLWREIVVLIGAVVLCVAAGAPPAAGRAGAPAATPVAAALAVALVTPVFPAKLLLFPFLLSLLIAVVPRSALARGLVAIAFLGAAYFSRYSIATVCVVAAMAIGAPLIERARLLVPAYAGAIALFALWPWSGLVARAMPRFLSAEEASPRERPVWVALEAAGSVSIDAPPQAHFVVITASGANASRMRVGRVVGRVEVVGRTGEVMRSELRIGDLADFGFTRREHFFASRNPVPRTPLDDVHGYGIAAWLHTAGRIGLASADEIATVRVTAAPGLPAGARLQIEAIEFE